MKKKKADYFTHDMNAQDDPKCIKLINELGMAGYGIFWALIEKLRAEPERRLRFDDLEAFAIRWHTDVYVCINVIKQYKLFVFDEEFFYSFRLTDDLATKSAMARYSVNHRWKNKNNNTDSYERIQSNTIETLTKPYKEKGFSVENGKKKDSSGGSKKMVY